jgi:hypothetical protein
MHIHYKFMFSKIVIKEENELLFFKTKKASIIMIDAFFILTLSRSEIAIEDHCKTN